MTHVNLNNPDPAIEAAIARVSESGERIFLQSQWPHRGRVSPGR